MTFVLLTLGWLTWLGYLYAAIRLYRDVPRLSRLSPKPPPRWPKLSLIVPARNEAAELEGALRSKLSADYPELEVVVVDDRSTDDTGKILDALAKEDSRIVPLHLRVLPDGWLGKLHAMARGIEVSQGDFILLSDADVHLAPGSLRKVVAWAEQQSLDHIAGVPRVTAPGLVLQSMLQAVMRLVLLVFRPWAVSNPRSTASAGIGAFNLLRRSAYDRTPGLAWLKMEVGDDAALGQMMKLSGARCAVVSGAPELSLRFYASIADTARHTEKVCGVGGRRPSTFALICVALWCAEMAPFFVLIAQPGLRLAAAACCLIAVVDAGLFAAWVGSPLLSALLLPLGSTLMTAVGLRSAALAAWRGGIVWRGTFYSRTQLKAGARYQFHPNLGQKPWQE